MTPPKRPGRKPLDDSDRSVKVSISLPSKQFDALCALARRQAVSVPEAIRRAMVDSLAIKNTKN